MGYGWPKEIEERPLLTHVEGSTMFFEDKSSAEVDVILMATGYKHHFPFLNADLRLESENKLWVEALKNGVMSNKNDQLYYLSMQNQFYTYVMFSCETRYVRDLIMGRVDPATPLKDCSGKTFTNADFSKIQDEMTNPLEGVAMQGKYCECLMEATGYGKEFVDPVKYTQGINQTFADWVGYKVKDIMTFRNYGHASLVTGKQSPCPHPTKTWVLSKNADSVQYYVALHKE